MLIEPVGPSSLLRKRAADALSAIWPILKSLPIFKWDANRVPCKSVTPLPLLCLRVDFVIRSQTMLADAARFLFKACGNIGDECGPQVHAYLRELMIMTYCAAAPTLFEHVSFH
jgi:hypothetical protein